MADIWKPAMRVNIKELKAGFFLFQFYHSDDLQWVLKGGPWSFDNATLVLNTIGVGEDPMNVPLYEVDFWIQKWPSSWVYVGDGRKTVRKFLWYVLTV